MPMKYIGFVCILCVGHVTKSRSTYRQKTQQTYTNIHNARQLTRHTTRIEWNRSIIFFSPSVHFVFTFYIWAHSICLELCWILIEMWKGNTLKQFNYVVKMCKCDTAEVVECLDGFLLAISLPNTRFAVLNYNLQRMKNRHSIWIHGNLSIPFSTL